MTPRQAAQWTVVAANRAFIEVRVRQRVDEPFVEDVVQNALILAWRLILEDRATFDEAINVTNAARAWLTTIVRGIASDWRKTPGAGWIRGGVQFEHDVPGPSPVARLEARAELRVMGYRLNRADRALVDAVGRGVGIPKIAADTGTPQGTVYTRLRYLRKYLRHRRSHRV